jgi:IS5 family transposase
VLHKTISAISAASWEVINRTVVSSARQEKLERGTTVRIDSTVTQALMHAPSDSSLLWDGVRVMTRLLEQVSAIPGAPAIVWHSHRRLAKKRALAIQYGRGKARKAKLYRDLIAATRATMAALQHAAQCLTACASIAVELWRCQLRHYLPLIERVIAQAERRVFAGEAVPAGEKLVSLFEPHADIIVKGGRDVHYGHKLNLTTGRSGLILDVVIETGNPADSERFLPMLDRHTSRSTAARRARRRPMAATPRATISTKPRPGA